MSHSITGYTFAVNAYAAGLIVNVQGHCVAAKAIPQRDKNIADRIIIDKQQNELNHLKESYLSLKNAESYRHHTNAPRS